MGDAKRRQQALAFGQPWPEDMHRCPACFGRRTAIAPAEAMGLSHVPTRYGVCADCKSFWEAYPDDWQHDAVGAEPCDNCAFLAGSPEAGDREGWLELLSKLRDGGAFSCHKGAPILLDRDAGTVEFDAEWIRRKGRTCAGFLRAMQQWPDWLERRFGPDARLDGGDA